MLKFKYFVNIISFALLSFVISCDDNNDDIISPDTNEYNTYSWFNASIGKSGNDIVLLDNMQKSIDSIISLVPANVKFAQIKKSQNESENIQAELNQIEIFNKAFENAHNLYNPENYKDDTSKIIHFSYNIGLKKNDNLIKIAEFSYVRALPYLKNSKWINENNSDEFIEFYDFSDVKISYLGKTLNTTYRQMIAVKVAMPDSTNILLKFTSGKRAYIENTITKEKTYFVKQ